jgi:hypothetical protein
MKIKQVETPVVGVGAKGMKGCCMSVANTQSKEYPAIKTDGVKIRGAGAAIKGVMARGPMG